MQDRTFDEHGALVETERRDNGMLGDTLLVNGTFAPWFEVTAELTRLRLLNASAARSYYFGFSDGRLFSMIASDGGLLEAPIDLERIMLTPGERAEILVRMQPGEEVVLRSFPKILESLSGLLTAPVRLTNSTFFFFQPETNYARRNYCLQYSGPSAR